MEYIFYHIHKKGNLDNEWKAGNTIDFGKEYNQFFLESLLINSKIIYKDKEYPIENLYNYFINNNDYNSILKLTNNYNALLSEYQILIRELGLEQIRNKYYPNLPTRQKCIWLCRNNQIDYWKKRINDDNIKIFKIKIFNKPSRFNEARLPLPSDSYSEILKKAKDYWTYNNEFEDEKDEYLYIGKITILEEIKLEDVEC